MKQQAFEAAHRSLWERFGERLAAVKNGYRLGTDDSAAEFLRDYQMVARSLALAGRRGYSRALTTYLNELVVRGHNVLYAHRSGFGDAFLRFAFAGFPRAVRREWRFVLVSALFLVLPLVGLALAVASSPDLVYSVMSESGVAGLEAMYDPAGERVGVERASDSDFQMFGFYVFNNVGIGFRVFASGVLFGIGTVVQLVVNGVHIGAAAGHLVLVGYQQPFFSFVVGHGAFELTAIVLSGAAGLLLGHAIIAPGRDVRVVALKKAGRRAVTVVCGATVMLLVAAFVEAFWSSSATVAPIVKYVVGGALWLLVIGYLLFAGRARGSR